METREVEVKKAGVCQDLDEVKLHALKVMKLLPEFKNERCQKSDMKQ